MCVQRTRRERAVHLTFDASQNAFDNDLITRCEAKIVPVSTPIPKSSLQGEEPLYAFSKDTVKEYEEAYIKAEKEGTRVKVLLVCNPHVRPGLDEVTDCTADHLLRQNPSGAIYPRETIVALTAFAAKHDLHLVMDE
jgi:hypothetical protein